MQEITEITEEPWDLSLSGPANNFSRELMEVTVETPTFPKESVDIPDSDAVCGGLDNLEFPWSRGSCQERFLNPEDLHIHQKLVPHYPCKICGRLFFNKARLRDHRKTHEPKSPCQIFGALLTKQSLRRHLQALHSESAEVYRKKWREGTKRSKEKKKVMGLISKI